VNAGRAPSSCFMRQTTSTDLDLLPALQRLWARKYFVLLALFLAAAAALLTRYSVGSAGLVAKRSSTSSSSLQVLVDTRYSSLARVALPTTAATVTARAPLYADYAASLPLRDMIAVRAGVPASSLNVTANTTETESPSGTTVSTSYNAAPAPRAKNQVVLAANDLLPVLGVTASAGSASHAAALVNATVAILRSSVTALERNERIGGPNRMVLRSLGSAKGTTVSKQTSLVKTILAGLVVLVVLLLLILALDGARRYRRQASVVGSPA
jgi:hypothetical protein